MSDTSSRFNRWTLKDVREAFNDVSGRASDIARNLCFAGLALIWLFSGENPEGISHSFKTPIYLFVFALGVDLFQYIAQAIMIGWQNYKLEGKVANESEYATKYHKAPDSIEWVYWFLFLVKIILTFLAYKLTLSAISETWLP